MRKLTKLVRRLRQQSGYSLVELLVTMSILGIVLGGLTTVWVSGSRAELDMNRRFQAQQNARLAFGALRSDVHTACNAVAAPGGTELDLYPVNPSGTSPPCASSATVAWCVTTSTQLTGRYALWRVASAGGGAGCGSPTSGTRKADFLYSASASAPVVFAVSVPTTGSGMRESTSADIPVSAVPGTDGRDLYELQDTIVLRNAPRA